MILDKLLNLGRKIIPKPIFNFFQPIYHLSLGLLAVFLYRFPSRKLKVIGITGTKGKSTTLYLAGKTLEEAGFKVGWISSLSIKIADKEWLNPYHLTMPGRMFIQKTLKEMVKAGCEYALIEVTSEGIKQHRHNFIDFDTAVFTNLAPEHLEAHGGFENYKKAKGKLFKSLKRNGKSIINLDDNNVDYFSQFKAKEKIGFSIRTESKKLKVDKIILGVDCKIEKTGISFIVKDTRFNLKLLGIFNIYNALSAISIGLLEKISLNEIKLALESIKVIPGRMEEISQSQNFRVFVDLAHTPDSFEQVFKLAKKLSRGRIISVFGSAGGGRDKWKRPELGKIASRYSDYIILTNEDPYSEDPVSIVDSIKQGIGDSVNFEKIMDRRQAINKALSLAKEKDIVLILGKGTEATMVVGSNSIPWDDRRVVREELGKLYA